MIIGLFLVIFTIFFYCFTCGRSNFLKQISSCNLIPHNLDEICSILWMVNLDFGLVIHVIVSNNNIICYLSAFLSVHLLNLLSCVLIYGFTYFQDKFLNIIGEKHQNFEFLHTLSSKCSYNIFSSEHVRCILDILSSNTLGNKHLEASCVRLLLVRSFLLLCGSE